MLFERILTLCYDLQNCRYYVFESQPRPPLINITKHFCLCYFYHSFTTHALGVIKLSELVLINSFLFRDRAVYMNLCTRYKIIIYHVELIHFFTITFSTKKYRPATKLFLQYIVKELVCDSIVHV